jgi:hypothetical protein
MTSLLEKSLLYWRAATATLLKKQKPSAMARSAWWPGGRTSPSPFRREPAPTRCTRSITEPAAIAAAAGVCASFQTVSESTPQPPQGRRLRPIPGPPAISRATCAASWQLASSSAVAGRRTSSHLGEVSGRCRAAPRQQPCLRQPGQHTLQPARRLGVQRRVAAQAGVLRGGGWWGLLLFTWSMTGSQATPVRPRPGLPVGEMEVPRVTSGLERVREMGRGRPRPVLPSVEECRTLGSSLLPSHALAPWLCIWLSSAIATMGSSGWGGAGPLRWCRLSTDCRICCLTRLGPSSSGLAFPWRWTSGGASRPGWARGSGADWVRPYCMLATGRRRPRRGGEGV